MQLETDISGYSSAIESSRTLARRTATSTVERFLVTVLNTNFADKKARLRVWRQFADLLPQAFRGLALLRGTNLRRHGDLSASGVAASFYEALTRNLPSPTAVIERLSSVDLPPLPLEGDGHLEELCANFLGPLVSDLRGAWILPAGLDRELGLFLVSVWYCVRSHARFFGSAHHVVAGNWKDPILLVRWFASDPCLLVLLHTKRIADRLRLCPNPNCPAPYFIAYRRGQRYCSDTCAQPAQREFKREWWREHGKDWRKSHKKQSQRKRGK